MDEWIVSIKSGRVTVEAEICLLKDGVLLFWSGSTLVSAYADGAWTELEHRGKVVKHGKVDKQDG